MFQTVCVLSLAVAALLVAMTPVPAQQERRYDSRGNSVGTTVRDSTGSVRHYDAQGRSLGTSSTDSAGTTRYYDSRGRSLGTTTGK